MSAAVAVVGSLNLDAVVGVDRLPGRGETVLGTGTFLAPGGKGANQAAAARAVCDDVAMIGRVGDDAAGDRLVADLADRGVLVTDLRSTAGVPTGTATVAVEAGSGENLIVVAPGANAELAPADVQIRAVHEAAVVLLQLEIPMSAVLAAADHATGLVVLNPAPPQPLSRDLLERVDVLVPNEWELTRLADAAHDRGHELADLADLARTVTSGDVVVTIGARGALVVPANGPWLHVAPPEVHAVDTTGAGDCFCGALSAALATGQSLLAAARFAVCAAALSTTAPGARGRLPDRESVLRIMPVGNR